ncbi:MAG: LytR C-terminal domain-containing protein [Archangium sp.]|nr:LytR C-terminal domain-containing protein [Archangium sp.]
MLSTLVAVMLTGAPLTFDEGEFLGFTKDGDRTVWLTSRRVTWGDAPHFAKLAVSRHQLQATEEEFELEVGPLDGKGPLKPGSDVAKWEAWKQKNPIVKLESLEGVKTSIRADGKPATTWGGTGKTVKVELVTERLGVTHTRASMLAENMGKKVRKTTAAAFLDPTGRRAVFVLTMEAGGGEPVSSEMVEAFVGPTAFVYVASQEQRKEKELLIERAGFAVTGGSESSKAAPGVVVRADAKTMAAAETLAKALGGKAVKGKVDKQLGEFFVGFDVAIP